VFQRVLNFIIGNPILIIIILGGLFNAAVRIAQKTKEQRARREEIQRISRQKQESLRTGRSTITQPPPQQAQQTDQNTQRRERIEALRQERMEQLRALREKRASGSSTSPSASTSSISQNHPNLPPIPVQGQSQSQAQRRTPQQPTRQSRPKAQQQLWGSSSATRPSSPQTGASSRTAQPPSNRPNIVAVTQETSRVQRKRINTPQSAHQEQPPGPNRNAGQLSEKPSKASKAPKPKSGQSARSMLSSRASIRQAIVLKEILDAPISLRDQDIDSGSIMS
jgi:hypothetical protein